MAFKFKLSPEAERRRNEHLEWEIRRKAEFANLTNKNLVASARLYMANMRPLDFAPGEPVYDATMWHIILPELLRRIENHRENS